MSVDADGSSAMVTLMAEPRPPILFKFLIVGLPVGLAISIVIALLLYYADRGPELGLEESAERFAAPITESDLKDTMELLSRNVGPRSLSKNADAAQRARKFVQSSLGSNNMGYKVGLLERKLGELECPAVVAELPGGGRASEVIVVAAPYTSAEGSPGAGQSGSGVAAMLGIARALVGTEQERTIRFVSYANDSADPAARPEQFERHMLPTDDDRFVVAILDLDTIAFPQRESGVWERDVPMTVHAKSEQSFVDLMSTQFLPTTGLRFEWQGDISSPSGSAKENRIVPVLTLVAKATASPAGTTADLPDAYDFPRLTQSVQKLHSLILRLANPDSL